jgi:hypothetical protein
MTLNMKLTSSRVFRSWGITAAIIGCAAVTNGCAEDMTGEASSNASEAVAASALEEECSDVATNLNSLWLLADVAPIPGINMVSAVGKTLTAMGCDGGMNAIVARMETIVGQRLEEAQIAELQDNHTELLRVVRDLGNNIGSASEVAHAIADEEARARRIGPAAFEIQLTLTAMLTAIDMQALTENSAFRSTFIERLKQSQQRLNEVETDPRLNVRLRAGTFARIDNLPTGRGGYYCETEQEMRGTGGTYPISAPTGNFFARGDYVDLYGNNYSLDETVFDNTFTHGMSDVRAACRRFRDGYRFNYTEQLAPVVGKIEDARQFLLAAARQFNVSAAEYNDFFAIQPLPAADPMEAGKSFTGTGTLATYSTDNSGDCARLCLDNSACSGATFAYGSCTLKKGTGTTVTADPHSFGFAVTALKEDKYFRLSLMTKSKKFLGTGVAKDISTNNAAVCYRACLDNPDCTGGTFNAGNRTCSTRIGSGLVLGTDNGAQTNDYAFVLEGSRRNAHYDLRMKAGGCASSSALLKTFDTFSSQECYSICAADAACSSGTYHQDDFYCVLMTGPATVSACSLTDRAFILR